VIWESDSRRKSSLRGDWNNRNCTVDLNEHRGEWTYRQQASHPQKAFLAGQQRILKVRAECRIDGSTREESGTNEAKINNITKALLTISMFMQ